MLRSMYSAISGLRNHQTKMDVIGNNISNVNTHGFKKSRTVFKDMVSQSLGSASGSTLTTGGVNPKQVGLGSTMATIDVIHGGGSLQSTARTLDLAIDGEGFFMVADSTSGANGFVRYDAKNPNVQETTTQQGSGTGGTHFTNVLYTRAGNFYMDDDGYLVNSEGKYLVGVAPIVQDKDSDNIITSKDFPTKPTAATDSNTNDLSQTDPNDANKQWDVPSTVGGTKDGGVSAVADVTYKPIRIPTDATEISIGQDGTISFTDADGVLKWGGQIVLAKFSNAGGLQKVGNNYYQVTENSGDPYTQVGTVAGMGKIQSGYLEMSNVDLSEEFTEMIVAQRGFQANARTITTSDQILEELVNLKR